MAEKLRLTVACGDYEIVRALKEGAVKADGLELVMLTGMGPRERHWRMARKAEFDVCEGNVGAYFMERDHSAALASEASGQRGNSVMRAHSASEDARERADDTRPEPGSSARAALASEASGQRGNSVMRAHSASEDAREHADDTRPQPGSSARAALPGVSFVSLQVGPHAADVAARPA